MGNYSNELEQFIYEKCYGSILENAKRYVRQNPTCLGLRGARIEYSDVATLQSMLPIFTRNISIDGDVLSFDVVVDCIIELLKEDYRGYHSYNDYNYSAGVVERSKRLCISCEARITDRLEYVSVHKICPFSGSKKSPVSGVTASRNIVPKIYKDNLDKEAEAFLKEFYPAALHNPVPVPIREIAEKKLHLEIILGKCITKTFQIFGEICFSAGVVELYDPFWEIGEKVPVKRGTIIIDASTYYKRNLGCVNNTIAHEVFHWHRHRIYASIKNILRNEKFIACRCPTEDVYPEKKGQWSDEAIMEWQANEMAPRILMPYETFCKKVDELYAAYNYAGSSNKNIVLECIIDDLAEFYGVSKQSAKIRMINVGHTEAEKVYNHRNTQEPSFSDISPRDAFYEYIDNPDFQELINSGLFQYVNERFVIKDEKYISRADDGRLSLSEYARNHPQECTLQFSYRRINLRTQEEYRKDTFFRENLDTYERVPHFEADRNISVISLSAELRKKQTEFEAMYKEHQALTKTFWEEAYEIMQKKGWNAKVFSLRTQLNEQVYSRAKNNFDSTPDVRTVMAICVGLDLDIGLTERLLELAGHVLTRSKEHQAYKFIITVLRGRPIEERNEFLILNGFEPLGSKSRK